MKSLRMFGKAVHFSHRGQQSNKGLRWMHIVSTSPQCLCAFRTGELEPVRVATLNEHEQNLRTKSAVPGQMGGWGSELL